jgi:hypothetical protein
MFQGQLWDLVGTTCMGTQGDWIACGCIWERGRILYLTGLTGMNGKNRVLVVKCIMGTIVLVFFALAEFLS